MNEEISYCNCVAHGCPMLGVMTRSTTGSKEWYCAIHFGAPATRWNEITGELQRLGWLVKITRDLRAGRHDAKAVEKEIRLNQSSHLIQGEHESGGKYLARLEATLMESCKPRQNDLATTD